MKFISSAKELTAALALTSKSTGNSLQRSVLDCVLLEAKDNTLMIYATDGLMAIKTKLTAEITEEGVAAIPAKLFFEVASKLPEDEIYFESTGTGATLKCRNSVVKLSESDAAEFPAFPDMGQSGEIQLEKATLKKLIDATVFSVSQTDENIIFTGEYIEFENDVMTVVSSDTFRLSMASGECKCGALKKALVPAKAMKEISRLTEGRGEIHLFLNDRAIMITSEETQLYSRLLEGDYISYKSLIRPYESQLRLETKLFREAIERVSVIARGTKDDVLQLKAEEDCLYIYAASEYGDMTDEVPVYHEGKQIEARFRTKYLYDALKAITDDEILIQFSGYICIIRPVSGDNFIYLIMTYKK